MAKDKKNSSAPSSQSAPKAASEAPVDALLRRLGWDREVPAQLAAARQLATESEKRPGHVDEIVACAQALGIDLSAATPPQFGAVADLMAQRAKARAAKVPAASTAPANEAAEEDWDHQDDAAEEPFVPATKLPGNRLQEVATKYGLDLRNTNARKRAMTLLRGESPKASAKPLVHNPFAALGKRGAA